MQKTLLPFSATPGNCHSAGSWQIEAPKPSSPYTTCAAANLIQVKKKEKSYLSLRSVSMASYT